MKNERSLIWCLLLYPEEDLSHKEALKYISTTYECAYIVHNKDVDKNGEIIKSHTHVVVKFPNYRWRTALAEELKIPQNYLEKCRNMENALEYLIHFKDTDKFQYDFEDVKGILKNKLKKFIENNGKDENEKVLDLLNYIFNYNGYLSVSNFSYYCSSVGKWDVFRRSALILIKCIEEHNKNL